MESHNKTPWWRPALFIFGRVSVWVAGPLILALVLGKYLDRYFNTKPWIFLGLTAIAFVISLIAIVRIIRSYIGQIEREAQEKKKNKEIIN